MLRSMQFFASASVLSCFALVVGCGSSSGDDDTNSGSPNAGKGGTAANGGSAGSATTGGAAGLAGGTSGAGGSSAGMSPGGSGGSGGSTGGCTSLNLADGATGPNGLVRLYKKQDFVSFLGSVGTDSSHAYFSEGSGESSVLNRIAFADGSVEKLGTYGGSTTVVHGDHIYFVVTTDSAANKYALKSAPLSDVTTSTLLADDVGTLTALEADDDALYWSANGKPGVWSMPVTGGTPTNIAGAGDPNGMVLQGDSVYWLDFDSEYLERVPKTGGTPERLVEIFFGGMMASDANAIYWADSSAEEIDRWALGATQSTTLVNLDFFNEPEGLVVDGGTVYYATGFGCSEVWKIGADGSGKTQIAQGFETAGLLGVDPTHVYVIDFDGVYRVDR